MKSLKLMIILFIVSLSVSGCSRIDQIKEIVNNINSNKETVLYNEEVNNIQDSEIDNDQQNNEVDNNYEEHNNYKIYNNYEVDNNYNVDNNYKTYNSYESYHDYEVYDDYIIPDSNSRKLTREELSIYSLEELSYIRNEIFARHGYIFKKEKYYNYFIQKDWYVPNEYFDGSVTSLNKIEQYNVNLIKELEGK